MLKTLVSLPTPIRLFPYLLSSIPLLCVLLSVPLRCLLGTHAHSRDVSMLHPEEHARQNSVGNKSPSTASEASRQRDSIATIHNLKQEHSPSRERNHLLALWSTLSVGEDSVHRQACAGGTDGDNVVKRVQGGAAGIPRKTWDFSAEAAGCEVLCDGGEWRTATVVSRSGCRRSEHSLSVSCVGGTESENEWIKEQDWPSRIRTPDDDKQTSLTVREGEAGAGGLVEHGSTASSLKSAHLRRSGRPGANAAAGPQFKRGSVGGEELVATAGKEVKLEAAMSDANANPSVSSNVRCRSPPQSVTPPPLRGCNPCSWVKLAVEPMPTAEKPGNDQGEGMEDGIKELEHQQAAGEVYEESRQVSSRTVEEALRKLGAIDLKQMRISYKWDEAVRLEIFNNRAKMILPALHACTYP